MAPQLFSAALFLASSLAPVPTSGFCATFLLTAYDRFGLSPVFRDGSSVHTPGDVVAVDPSVVPLGSMVTIDGLGSWLARDTGSGVRGLHLDLALSSHRAAVRFGVQHGRACVVGP